VAQDSDHRLIGADGRLLLDRLRFARRARTRMRGLLGRRELSPGEGLAFREKSIHMFFMRMALDIVFCDQELRVLKVVPELRPWKMAACAGARYVLEIGPGEAGRLGIAVGQRLTADPPF
jgi:uncharacterized membrane protein (UPF0127 family)